MTAHSHVSDLIEILLGAVAQEANTTQDHLSVEIESVVTRGLLEAFKRGGDHVYERPTEPPPPPPPPRPPSGTHAVRIPTPGPLPAVRSWTPPPIRALTPQPRPRIATPMPRKDQRRDDED